MKIKTIIGIIIIGFSLILSFLFGIYFDNLNPSVQNEKEYTKGWLNGSWDQAIWYRENCNCACYRNENLNKDIKYFGEIYAV